MMLTESAEGKPGLGMYLEMLGDIHRRLHVKPQHFGCWSEALIASVEVYDPQFDEEIRQAWERVIEQIIRSMRQTPGENHLE